MKILTLNTHSLIEKNYNAKLDEFVKGIIEEQVDIFVMQEVNQTITESELTPLPANYQGTALLKVDNHAAIVAEKLAAQGLTYYWTYCICHIGYDKYDEGLAIFSKYPLVKQADFYISRIENYSNYRTRKALWAQVQGEKELYNIVSTHMGWWQEEIEPFKGQWENLTANLATLTTPTETTFIMGDLNNRSDVPNEGYALATKTFYDLYTLAKAKDEGYTTVSTIDGWKNKEVEYMRIDYILCNKPLSVQTHKVIFNGKNRPMVSDHYGVLIEF